MVRRIGTSGNDTLTGTNFSDLLWGNGGNDLLRGLGGSDDLEGDGGNDRLFGGGGNDELEGDDGRDLLRGGAGNDELDGDDGDDRLFGQAGRDTLDGGDGNDLLVGGGGADEFEFGDGDGRDRVRDFTNGVDRLDLDDLSRAEVQQVINNARQVNGNTVLRIEGDDDDGPTIITLVDFQRGQLDLGDFVFD
ncbi:calcium-binding protein [Paracoccus spongiarum]|uniref:Calcium-binding protein n=1 Tax=Paracoccus spongiarum TaxID=3064387 RepID=A0ABT9J7H0_9RHOB|nr:calcium-binding protein [Paracoccus sp. 2205BS29-5]MDP5305755.1 calcium-binding protein [Paracoccus sp. 2205BS29-5]